MRNVEADVYKERLDNEVSLNKIIFKTVSQLELPYQDKIRFLQIGKHEPRIESLISFLTEKTENSKGMISIEEKVRKEMNVAAKKKPIFESTFKSPGFSEKN